MRNVLPKGLQVFFFCFVFLIELCICFVGFALILIVLSLALLRPASLHVCTKVSFSNSDAVSMLSCLTVATNLLD